MRKGQMKFECAPTLFLCFWKSYLLITKDQSFQLLILEQFMAKQAKALDVLESYVKLKRKSFFPQ